MAIRIAHAWAGEQLSGRAVRLTAFGDAAADAQAALAGAPCAPPATRLLPLHILRLYYDALGRHGADNPVDRAAPFADERECGRRDLNPPDLPALWLPDDRQWQTILDIAGEISRCATR